MQIYFILPKEKFTSHLGFCSTFEEQLNHQHPFYKLSHEIKWTVFDEAFKKLYRLNQGRPGKPIRLMVSLLILKQLRNLSDEIVVEQWSENAYYQYFSGEKICLRKCSNKKEETAIKFIILMNRK